jgi:hypothetical protein
MQFPRTNKIRQDLEDTVGDNAVLLDELLTKIQWRRFFNYYCAFFGIFLASLFLLIVTVRFANWIF